MIASCLVHHAITWTNFNILLVAYCNIRPMKMSRDCSKYISFIDFKIYYGCNYLSMQGLNWTHVSKSAPWHWCHRKAGRCLSCREFQISASFCCWELWKRDIISMSLENIDLFSMLMLKSLLVKVIFYRRVSCFTADCACVDKCPGLTIRPCILVYLYLRL